jgi:D-alanyl-D-alanine dipeptidase
MKIVKCYFLILFVLSLNSKAQAQNSTNYGLKIIHDLNELRETIHQDPDNSLVEIRNFVPNVLLDIKYASKSNVFYTQFYQSPKAFVRLPVAKALANVQKELNQIGYGLKIYDGYRPYSVTSQMFEILPDTVYMGLPWTGSKHNRGIALDLTLIHLDTQLELKMPTPYDALVYASHPEFQKLPLEAIQNRDLLKAIMIKHGFVVDPVEWWHYNFVSTKIYELLDISFEELEKLDLLQLTNSGN